MIFNECLVIVIYGNSETRDEMLFEFYRTQKYPILPKF